MDAIGAGAAVSGLLAGILSGLFGIGGGIVLVPLLGLLLGLGQQQAQGATLAILLLPLGLPAVLAYARRVRIRWRLVAALVIGFLAGVGGGAQVATHVAERPLRAGFVLFLVAMAVRTWRQASGRRAEVAGAPPHARAPAWNGLWIGAVGGLLSGLLGIGGGIVMVPLLTAFVGLDQKEAQGTSLATMLPPVGLPGVLVYARAGGPFDLTLLAPLALGFGAGAFLGARFASRARTAALGKGFSVFILCAAAALTWRVIRG